jgi:hypothetical protein
MCGGQRRVDEAKRTEPGRLCRHVQFEKPGVLTSAEECANTGEKKNEKMRISLDMAAVVRGVAERKYEQPCPAILAALRITHHRTTAVVDLRLFSWRREDDACWFRTSRSAQLTHETLHRLIAPGKAVVRDQVLPDRLAIASRTRPCSMSSRYASQELQTVGFVEKAALKSGVTCMIS